MIGRQHEHGRRRDRRAGRWSRAFDRRARLLAAIMLIGLPGVGVAQVATTLNGPPVQVAPYVSEPGVPAFQIPLGTPTPPATGGTTGDGAGDSGTAGTSTALSTMLGTSWGAQAAAAAQSLGVNASALAATCVLESGCQNVSSSGGAQGAFQMFPAAYQEGLQTALAANPNLQSEVVPGSAGMNDPVTEAIAASGYLMKANQALESAGVSNPTVLDARGYYNMGPAYGPQLALADSSEPIANVLSGMSAAALTANGIAPGETVGQWRSTVSAKIGSAAGQSVTT